MSPKENCLFTIEEVTSPQSQHLSQMNRWLELSFPEYWPPRFNKLLARLRHPDGRHRIQIFIGLADDSVAGLVQLFYQQWQRVLLADIDLLGVLEPYRRSGLASMLVQRGLRATSEMARRYQVPAAGVVTLIDPRYSPILQLHRKQGGQIREDCQYPGGDIIVWYPMQREYADITTSVLVAQLRRFGRLLER